MCGYYPVGYQLAKYRKLVAGEYFDVVLNSDWLRNLYEKIPCPEHWEGFRRDR